MNRKVIIWDNQNWCYVYHKNDMNGGFDDIYIYRSIMWRMIWHVYITSLTINTRQIWPSLQKKDICVSYWKLPGQEELETDQVFFLNTVQFARTFCFTWLTWFTPRGIHRGQTWHWSFWARLCSLQNEQFHQNGQFHHSNVKLLVLISNLPFHSDWLRLWCLWQMKGFIGGYKRISPKKLPTFFLFPWLNYCSITLWAQNIGECWSQYHSWPLSIPIFAVYSIAHNNVFSFVYMAASQAASSTL